MIDVYREFIRDEVRKQIKKVYNAIEPEYMNLGTLNREIHPSKKGISVAITIQPYKRPEESRSPPYDDLYGELFTSLRNDLSFVLGAELALSSGGEWGKEIADIDIQFTSDTDPRKTIQELLESAGDKMIEEFHTLLPEINGNLREWILERERKD